MLGRLDMRGLDLSGLGLWREASTTEAWLWEASIVGDLGSRGPRSLGPWSSEGGVDIGGLAMGGLDGRRPW